MKKEIPSEVCLEFHIYDYLNPFGFDDGARILEEEESICKLEAQKFVKLLGIINDKWKPEISRKHIYYVTFLNLQTNEYLSYYDLEEQDRRTVEKRIDEIKKCF